MSADVPTWGAIVGAVGFFILVSGTLWGIWWRIEGKVDTARREASAKADAAAALASMAREEIAAHKLHAAEVFATKSGMAEQTAQLLRAIEGVGNRIDGLHERLDRAFEARPPVRRT